ncbi:streptophobe family protein [Streptomyces sp. NPDC089919]|uniref:streptophobe family protein n=1 Tax=Streptomyces sp. NPDC089919 TaxID=3155188 RepID=UPI0034297647
MLLTAVAAVSWALAAMAAVAAAGLHLLGADAAGGSLGAMTAAAVVLAVGGAVTPSGDVSAFGLSGPAASGAVDIAPLGVSLAGALALAVVFLRSVRWYGGDGRQLAVRGAAVVVLFVAMAGGLVWLGHDAVTLDGVRLPGGGSGDGGPAVPGLGDLGGLGGLLPDRVGDLVEARARVGFTVRAAPTLLAAGLWAAGVLLVAVCAGRRTAAGRWLGALRPAVSAVVAVLLVTVAAALAAAGWAAAGDEHPRRILGAALLGAPNGAWSAVPLGLLVPFDGRVGGSAAGLLPDPMGELLGGSAGEPVTVARLAGYDGRVWLLVAAVLLAVVYGGVLAGVRMPRTAGPGAFALRAAVRAAAVWAVALPLLVRLTGVSVRASLSVLGIDAFGASLELHGRPVPAALLGAGWGALLGGAGALAAWRWAPVPVAGPAGAYGPSPGPYTPSPPPGVPRVNPYRDGPPGREPGPGAGYGRDVSGDATLAGPSPWGPRRGGGGGREAEETIAGVPPPPPRPRRPAAEPFTPPPPPGPPPAPRRPPEDRR